MVSFQEDAAKKTSKSQSTVKRKTRIGSKLRGVEEALRGTAVEDKQKDLLYLAKIAEKTPDKLDQVVEKIVKGETQRRPVVQRGLCLRSAVACLELKRSR